MLKKFNEYLRDKGIQVESFTPDTPKNTHTTDGKDVAGLKEVIEVEGLGKMKVKLDSGNTAMNALIVQDYYEDKDDGTVKFDFNGEEKKFEVVKHIRIWHHGKSTERPVIKVNIKFNGKVYKDEFVDLKISDLTGTKNYRCRMLLCKDFMKKADIVIDPSKEFKLTDKKELPQKKKKKKMNESIWSDMQERGTGDITKKEDDVDLLDMDEFFDYIKKNYGNKLGYVDKFTETITINPKGNLYIFLHYENGELSKIQFAASGVSSSKKYKQDLEQLKNSFPEGLTIKNEDGYYYITETSNKSVIKLIDFFLSINLFESIWSDMQERGTGDITKKEDEKFIKLRAEFDDAVSKWGQPIPGKKQSFISHTLCGYEVANNIVKDLITQYGKYVPNYGDESYHTIKLKNPITVDEKGQYDLYGNTDIVEIRLMYHGSLMFVDSRGSGGGSRHLSEKQLSVAFDRIIETVSDKNYNKDE